MYVRHISEIIQMKQWLLATSVFCIAIDPLCMLSRHLLAQHSLTACLRARARESNVIWSLSHLRVLRKLFSHTDRQTTGRQTSKLKEHREKLNENSWEKKAWKRMKNSEGEWETKIDFGWKSEGSLKESKKSPDTWNRIAQVSRAWKTVLTAFSFFMHCVNHNGQCTKF